MTRQGAEGAPRGRIVTGARPPTVPADFCRVCWRDQYVVRDGELWLDHIGPLSSCTHACHDETFLGSTS
ncbi:hypothetical protein [Pseudonocardia sp. McavD-2-B]|uniref:hypothetical protein n=1 Tax=Pseudonocardia sp. McavD-2-B TaxID=2954499 RepID=UPI002097128A|nr:hypothetical protein [Pseudonocardia sp. McavD-2-B]MCO7193207.1 hypothetical protein [Pseudonocardia sp. McavD-2-B]